MISKSEPAAALAAAPLFADLPSDIVSSLALELRRIELAPGKLLWRQGEASGALHLVESGRLTVMARGPGEREVELAQVGPGDVLGELPLLAGGEHAASIRAVEFASVLALDRSRFRALLASLDPSAEALRRRLLNIVCERLRRQHAQLSAKLGGGPALDSAGEFVSEPAPAPPHSYLARLALFGDLADQELDELLAVSDVVDIARGAELCAEGATPEFCAVTLCGALEELVRRSDGGVRVRLAGPGFATCYVGLLDGLPSSVSVSARERARVALVSRAAFDELVSARTQAGRSFLEALQRDLVGALRVAQRPLARLSFG